MVIQVQLGGGGGGNGPPGWLVYVPGAIMIGLGLAILFLPQLLQLLVASLCFFIGTALILAPRGLRNRFGPGRNPFDGLGGGGFGAPPPPTA